MTSYFHRVILQSSIEISFYEMYFTILKITCNSYVYFILVYFESCFHAHTQAFIIVHYISNTVCSAAVLVTVLTGDFV